MNSNKMTTKTAADVLAERDELRKAGLLAHTPNGRGEFYARIDCPCYTCQDVLDPTGELAAKAYNEAATLPAPSKLERQYASCLSCSISHSCCEPCRPMNVSLNVRLPPPPPAVRECALGPSATGEFLSPIVGLLSPRSLSSGSQSIEESCRELEDVAKHVLGKLLLKYQMCQTHVEAEMAQPGLKHDEMAAYDAWWTELDKKMLATKDLLEMMDT